MLSDDDVRDIIFNETALKEYTDDMKSEMTSEMKINSLYLIGIGLGVWIFGWIQARVHPRLLLVPRPLLYKSEFLSCFFLWLNLNKGYYVYDYVKSSDKCHSS